MLGNAQPSSDHEATAVPSTCVGAFPKLVLLSFMLSMPRRAGSLIPTVIFLGALLWIEHAFDASSADYRPTVAAARNSPEVRSALGTPIETGFFCIPKRGGPYRHIIALKGPNGFGDLYYAAEKINGQ